MTRKTRKKPYVAYMMRVGYGLAILAGFVAVMSRLALPYWIEAVIDPVVIAAAILMAYGLPLPNFARKESIEYEEKKPDETSD
jgi:xanthine/uracil permease